MEMFSLPARFAAALILVLSANGVVFADSVSDVGKILQDIRQDQPVPNLAYLKQVRPMNNDSAYYQGRYNGIEVAVETRPNSNLVASILIQVPGPDRTRDVLPAVTRVLGPPHSSDRKNHIYSWSWPTYRTASVHYSKNDGPAAAGTTIISLFYR